VLVDSVVNSEKSVEEFVQHIRALDSTIRIVVIAGVIQAQSLSDGILEIYLPEMRTLASSACACLTTSTPA
jgi:hypothetical protein